jgi:hypothetical protein
LGSYSHARRRTDQRPPADFAPLVVVEHFLDYAFHSPSSKSFLDVLRIEIPQAQRTDVDDVVEVEWRTR